MPILPSDAARILLTLQSSPVSPATKAQVALFTVLSALDPATQALALDALDPATAPDGNLMTGLAVILGGKRDVGIDDTEWDSLA